MNQVERVHISINVNVLSIALSLKSAGNLMARQSGFNTKLKNNTKLKKNFTKLKKTILS